jgi:DNA polymerase-4
MGKTLTLKVKYANFQQVTRSMTFRDPLQSKSDMCAVLPRLLARTQANERRVRLLGVTVSNLCPHQGPHVQGDLFAGAAGADGSVR